jgi:hypothetical protein
MLPNGSAPGLMPPTPPLFMTDIASMLSAHTPAAGGGPGTRLVVGILRSGAPIRGACGSWRRQAGPRAAPWGEAEGRRAVEQPQPWPRTPHEGALHVLLQLLPRLRLGQRLLPRRLQLAPAQRVPQRSGLPAAVATALCPRSVPSALPACQAAHAQRPPGPRAATRAQRPATAPHLSSSSCASFSAASCARAAATRASARFCASSRWLPRHRRRQASKVRRVSSTRSCQRAATASLRRSSRAWRTAWRHSTQPRTSCCMSRARVAAAE